MNLVYTPAVAIKSLKLMLVDEKGRKGELSIVADFKITTRDYNGKMVNIQILNPAGDVIKDQNITIIVLMKNSDISINKPELWSPQH